MSTSGMLQDKRAVVFGGGGSIGAAVAQELASEGAEVFLAGRVIHERGAGRQADRCQRRPRPR